MNNKLPKKYILRGQMLIGILISMAIFLILTHAIFTLISSSFEFISYNRARITARHLGQEKIELIRNMPYNSVGTAGGIPSGSLLQEENIDRNGLSFKVKTSIIYIDDQFDQAVPYDLLPTDYKRIRIEVSWQGIGRSNKNPIVYVTDVAPKGIETTATGGTLSILVFDANAQAVAGASVTISAPTVVPPVNLTLQTGANGRIILPGAPPCNNACYQITVSKSGYTSDRTYATSEIANPDKPNLSVLQGELVETSFSIDRVSTLNIATTNNRDNGFTILPEISLRIISSKTLGSDSAGTPIYKYNQTVITNSEGTYILNNIDWGSYNISLNGNSYDISGMNPVVPLTLIPNETVDPKLSLTAKSSNNLLILFSDQSSTPIASVSATLTDNISFNESIFSGNSSDPDFGQVFFANLDSGSYTLTATASGYLDYSNTIPVSGISQEKIILTAQ